VDWNETEEESITLGSRNNEERSQRKLHPKSFFGTTNR
jgi:hypothetical protein